MQDKAIRFDVAVAACALAISAIASAASVYQTHVIAEQFSATVWPYVSFVVSEDPTHLSVVMRNDGLGPALIRNVVITDGGKRVPSLDAIVQPLLAPLKEPHGTTMQSSTSSIEVGDVLPANQHITLIEVSGAPIVRSLIAAAPHLNLSICYCSLLGRCWIKQFDDPSGDPKDVSACPVS
jgi:hypothetical protein